MSKFVINDINIISGWLYDLPSNTNCSICRCSVNTTSIFSKSDINNICIGLCSHSFHEVCINSWLKNNKLCPLCFKDFILNKNI